MKMTKVLLFVFLCAWSTLPSYAQQFLYGAKSWAYCFPEQMTVFNNKMYFVMTNDTYGKEIYTSDGTTSGTTLFKDLNTGASNANPQYFTVADSLLFFVATTSSTGIELWQTDGSAGKTKLVADIASGSASSSPKNLFYHDGKLFFIANNGTNGIELWLHDVVTKSTTLVKDIYAGSNNSNVANMVYYNGYYYFTAVDGLHGNELWRTDGTTGGTAMFLDVFDNIYDLTGGSNPKSLVVFNNRLFFHADDVLHSRELISTDGSPGNLVRIDLNTVMESSTNNADGVGVNSSLTVLNNLLIFEGTDGTSAGLWVSGGDLASTTFVMSVNVIELLTIANNKLYFEGDNSTSDNELFVTDGTVAGSYLIAEVNAGGASYPAYVTEYNGDIYFSAYDGVAERMNKYDGTSVVDPFNNPYTGFSPEEMVVFNNKLYFFGGTGFENGLTNGDGLWVYDVNNPNPPTSVSDSKKGASTFAAFSPNPTTEYITFDETLENNKAQVFDLNGKLVTSFTIRQKNDVSSLYSGLYILKIEDENGQSYTFKMTKQ